MAEEEAEVIEIDMAELKKMKVADLKKKVAELGIEAAGTKAELLAKVEKYLSEQDADLLEGEGEGEGEGQEKSNGKEASGGDPAELEGEAEGEEEEEEEVAEGGAEEKDNPAEQSPHVIADAAKVIPPTEGTSDPNATTTAAVSPAAVAAATSGATTTPDCTAPPAAVPTTALSQAEKLKMRAQKFGSNESELAKKLARAERFGMPSADSEPGQGVNVDKLKKRADRFGVAVAPVLAKVELDDRKRRRLERFGTETASPELTEKKKKRLERFGIGTL